MALCLLGSVLLFGRQPSDSDLAERARWARAAFEGVVPEGAATAGLTVIANHDPVQLNSRAGRPLRLGETTYTRGLFCHAPSDVRVSLPGPASRLRATIGVDTNEQTSGGRGSVVFGVTVGGREAFRSDVMREGTPPVSVDVELGGAREFALTVGDSGDGIACDQADWTDAVVTLEDGTEVWLGDLPIAAGIPPYPTAPPFGFLYGGTPVSEMLAGWTVERSSTELDEGRTQYVVTYTDPTTRLEVRCVGVEYAEYPTVEWTVYLRNLGDADTPMIENLSAIDGVLPVRMSATHVVHHNTGSPCRADDFQPFSTPIGTGGALDLATAGGRSSNTTWPYWGVEGEGGGVLMALGWPGQWAAHFEQTESGVIRLRAGQERTHFVLHPGETVRTPLVVMQFWSGDRADAQNVWRRWMRAYNSPHVKGGPPTSEFAACSSHQLNEMINANEENQIGFIDGYLDKGLKLDFWWMDAGWYPNNGGWWSTGTWEVDKARFPDGLRAITDHAHGRGVKSIVWFEPERVHPDTWLYDEHPEWLLGADGGIKLLNLGNPEAWSWLVEHIDGLIVSEGIDLYRQDFNMDPLEYWRANDAEDRQGITEIGHVTGYLAYWDELRRRHPDMLIDSCASGGRRNDVESLRRAVPLLRSDYIIEPVGNQAQTYGLSPWVPFYGTGTSAIDPYMLRSVLCPHFTGCFDVRRDDLDWELARKLMADWKPLADCMLGDFYPLTPYSLANDQWIGWQFDLPEENRGAIQVFRRAESIYEAVRLRVRVPDPSKTYVFTDADTGEETTIGGADLAEKGLRVDITSAPGSAIVWYTVK